MSARAVSRLDDLLLLASLASRKRTACVGWSASDGTFATRYYRKHIVLPEPGPIKDPYGTPLISERDRASFLHTIYGIFAGLPNKDALRPAMYLAVPPRSTPSIEQLFLTRFAAMEHLVLDFRRRANLEFVLSPSRWSKLRRRLKAVIREETDLSLEQLSDRQEITLAGSGPVRSTVTVDARGGRDRCARPHPRTEFPAAGQNMSMLFLDGA
jgi:hypothetical protein